MIDQHLQRMLRYNNGPDEYEVQLHQEVPLKVAQGLCKLPGMIFLYLCTYHLEKARNNAGYNIAAPPCPTAEGSAEKLGIISIEIEVDFRFIQYN